MYSLHKITFLFALLMMVSVSAWAQESDDEVQSEYPSLWDAPAFPKYETRAVWLTTIGGLDWPRTKAYNAVSIEKQKAELCRILDNYQRININTVILQTRVRGSVIYPSAIEPWDDCLTGHPGKHPGYDPLQFCIEECHRRGMELHAWIVSIPLGKESKQRQYGSESILRRQPKLCKTVGGEAFMMPGAEGTAAYIASICREIAERYDIDGISLDYIRYPESTFRFSDDNLCPKDVVNKAAWRRENITRIVRAVHDAVKPLKPWLRLSSSPIGKYSDLPRHSSYGWNCFSAVWQDPQAWLRDNIQDMLFPMMYFQGNHFYPFLFDWQQHSYGHPVVPGLGIYFLDPREGKWELHTVRAEMHTARNIGIGGMAFYRGDFLTRNCKGIYTACHDEFFPYMALPVPMTWMPSATTPEAPQSFRNRDGMLAWQGDATYYNIYGSNDYPVDCSRAENLVAIRVADSTYCIGADATRLRYFAVTATNRYGIESPAAQEPAPEQWQPRTLNVPQLINRKTIVSPTKPSKSKSSKKKSSKK